MSGFTRSWLMWLVGLILTSPLGAVSNSITIKNLTGSTLTNYPFTISRIFASGDISSYAQPSGYAFWQCDKKTAWANGSLQHALISFRATISASSSITVTFINSLTPSSAGDATATAASSLSKSAMQNYDTGGGSGSWNAQILLTNGTTNTIDAKTILSAWNGTDTGINGLGVRYWLKGPVASQVIVEDRTSSRAYDSGFATGSPIHPIFVLTFYPGDGGSIAAWTGVKTEFDVENTWAGNTVPTGMQMVDDTYSVVLKTGASVTSVYSQSSFLHAARTRWRQKCWSGTNAERTGDCTLGGTPKYTIDYNLPYIAAASKSIFNYDTSLPVPGSVYDPLNTGGYSSGGGFSEVYLFTQSDHGDCPTCVGEFAVDMSAAGGRGDDKSLLSRWDTYYLYSMGSSDTNSWRMWDVFLGNGEVGAHVPIHYRDNLTGRNFCGYSAKCVSQSLDSISSTGRVISIDARPKVQTYPGHEADSGTAADILPVTGLAANSWQYSLSHQYEFAMLAYLIEGDYYQLEEVQFWASIPISQYSEDNCSYCRGQNHIGYAHASEQRITAWSIRALSDAAFLSLDGTPEKAYFWSKLATNLCVLEGHYNVTGTGYCDTSTASDNNPWYWGRHTSDFPGATTTNSIFISPGWISETEPCCDAAATPYLSAPWMVNFSIPMLGLAIDRGFPEATGTLRAMNKHMLGTVLDSAYNPWNAFNYREPQANSSGTYFSTWSGMKAALNSCYSTATSDPHVACSGGTGTSDLELNYEFVSMAAGSYLSSSDTLLDSDTVTTRVGTTAWTWLRTNVTGQSNMYKLPKWAILPRVPAASSSFTSGKVGVVGGAQIH